MPVNQGVHMSKTKNVAPVVSVLNMKGGVGKTTIAAHVFKHFFARLHRQVMLVDFDPQFNLTQTVLREGQYQDCKKENKTILRVMDGCPEESLFSVSCSTEEVDSIEDVSIILRVFRNTQKKLTLIPGDFDMVKYSLIDDKEVLNNAKNRFLNFIGKAQSENELICIDCNPSSSFMTQCAILASTHILIPVKPDKYSMLGLHHLLRYIDDFKELAKKPEIIVIINGTSHYEYNSTVESEIRAHKIIGPKTLANTLRQSKLLIARPDYTGFVTDKVGPYSSVVTASISNIVDELAKKLELSA
jgi:chromosome partitioning protein